MELTPDAMLMIRLGIKKRTETRNAVPLFVFAYLLFKGGNASVSRCSNDANPVFVQFVKIYFSIICNRFVNGSQSILRK